MQIRVLGCSGGIAAGCRTTAFLIDDDLLVDAGTGLGDLSLDELAQIDHILLSHSHLDHVLGVPLLADSVIRRRAGRPPIQVHGLSATLAALRDHVLNGVIWPDFTRLPSADRPVLALQTFDIGQVLRHADIATTLIYAKVDTAALGQLVRPWPTEPASVGRAS